MVYPLPRSAALAALRAATHRRAGNPGCEALVPGDEADRRELLSQRFERIEHAAGLKTDLAAHSLRHPDDDLGDGLPDEQATQILVQTVGRDDFEGAREGTAGVGEGNPRVRLAEVEGSDTSRVRLPYGQG
jgi:hypothetical protein